MNYLPFLLLFQVLKTHLRTQYFIFSFNISFFSQFFSNVVLSIPSDPIFVGNFSVNRPAVTQWNCLLFPIDFQCHALFAFCRFAETYGCADLFLFTASSTSFDNVSISSDHLLVVVHKIHKKFLTLKTFFSSKFYNSTFITQNIDFCCIICIIFFASLSYYWCSYCITQQSWYQSGQPTVSI